MSRRTSNAVNAVARRARVSGGYRNASSTVAKAAVRRANRNATVSSTMAVCSGDSWAGPRYDDDDNDGGPSSVDRRSGLKLLPVASPAPVTMWLVTWARGYLRASAAPAVAMPPNVPCAAGRAAWTFSSWSRRAASCTWVWTISWAWGVHCVLVRNVEV